MTELEQIKQIATQTCVNLNCGSCVLSKVCPRTNSKDVAKATLDLLSYNSDLSKCKVGDWVWTLDNQWLQIESINPNKNYPIVLSGGKQYTLDGKRYHSDYSPGIFITPPLCFNPVPKPESVRHFKKGERVLVSDTPNGEKSYRYFAEYNPNKDFPYVCFADGGDEWSSEGRVTGWKCCEKAENGEAKCLK